MLPCSCSLFSIFTAPLAALSSVILTRSYWENITIAMLTLFRIATFESLDVDHVRDHGSPYPMSWLYYVSFIFLSAFIFLNMMIGIVLETMQKESAAQEVEGRQRRSRGYSLDA